MFDYSWKIRLLIIIGFLLLLWLAIFLVQEHKNKARDLRVVENAQAVAETLENYYSKYNAYPSSEKVDLANIKMITEQGVGSTGNEIYFYNRLSWDRPVYLTSGSKDYLIEFSLTEKWKTWNINSREGAVCNIVSNMEMYCKDKPATFLDFFR